MDTTDRIGENVGNKTKGIGVKVRKTPKGIGNPYLPDDIIPNILCRLPAKNVSQCRLVCKGWRDLTLTRDFVDLHSGHSFPMILVANPGWHSPKFDHFLLDKWWESARTKLLIYKSFFDSQNIHPDYKLQFSHAGLIVFSEFVFPVVSILNPINLEKVTITLSRELGLSKIYGIFFHPSLREYCSLWRIEISYSRTQTRILYMVLNLGSNPFLKMITNPFAHKVKKRNSLPLCIGNYLYWMLEGELKEDNEYNGRSDIMQFDIIGEEFTVKPCPVPVETECDSDQTHLLNIDGALSFLIIFPINITIWRLKDHGEQLWTASNYTFSTENFQSIPRPIAVVDGNLAVLSDRRLLVCDLMQGTMKYFRKQKYRIGVFFLSHQMSFASLRNCQLRIYLNEFGQIGVV